MYNLFYNLKDRPFALKPDLKYFYNTRQHKRAIVHMRYGLEQPDGILVLTGEKGIGKTTIVSYLLSEMDTHKNIVALIQKPPQKDQDFLPTILASLQIPINEYQPKIMFNTLHDFMLKQRNQNKKVILIVDDAQSLSENCLEFIRLLSTLRQNENGLMQIVLVGTNDLEPALSDNSNLAFRQQISMSYNMHPLQLSDTREYINHRLKVAGWEYDPQIEDEVYAAVHQLTGGIPYEINRYCDRLLMLGMLQESHHLNNSDVARLTAATFETLEKFESSQIQKTTGFSSVKEDSEILPPPLINNSNELPLQESVSGLDVEKLLYEQAGKKSTVFFDKSTVITILVVYIISFFSIVLFDKISEKDSVISPVTSTIAESEKPVETVVNNFIESPRNISDDKEDEISESVKTPKEPQAENDITSIALLPKKNRNFESVMIEDQSSDKVVNKLFTAPESKQESNEKLAAQEKSIEATAIKPAIKSNEQTDRELEIMLAQLDEKPSSGNGPIVLSRAEMAENKPFVVKTLPDVLTDIELNQVVAQFEVAYQFGDMGQIDQIFSEQILSNNINSKKVLLDEYEKLFSITQYRKMRIFDLHWKSGAGISIGDGSFEASIREKGSLKKQQYKGNIILHVKKQEKGLEITELYYNYENL